MFNASGLYTADRISSQESHCDTEEMKDECTGREFGDCLGDDLAEEDATGCTKCEAPLLATWQQPAIEQGGNSSTTSLSPSSGLGAGETSSAPTSAPSSVIPTTTASTISSSNFQVPSLHSLATDALASVGIDPPLVAESRSRKRDEEEFEDVNRKKGKYDTETVSLDEGSKE